MSIRLMVKIWESGPSDRVELLVLLALADFANDDGECWPSMKTIAEKARLSERGAQKIIARLTAAGWISVTVKGGRRGCNVYRVRADKIKEGREGSEPGPLAGKAKTPNPVHPEPGSPRTGVQETPNGGSPEPPRTVKESSNADVLDAEFEEFWRVCPRKVGKSHARKAYIAARKKVSAAELLTAMKRHALEVRGRDPNYIPHPATWLNGERWADEPPRKSELRVEREGVRQQPRSQFDVIAERYGIQTSGGGGVST